MAPRGSLLRPADRHGAATCLAMTESRSPNKQIPGFSSQGGGKMLSGERSLQLHLAHPLGRYVGEPDDTHVHGSLLDSLWDIDPIRSTPDRRVLSGAAWKLGTIPNADSLRVLGDPARKLLGGQRDAAIFGGDRIPPAPK